MQFDRSWADASLRTPNIPARVLALSLLLGTSGFSALAQSIDVQEAGPHVEIGAGLSSRIEYRDLLLGDGFGVNAYMGAARAGFSASMWIARSHSSQTVYEAFLAYSHKLPWFDVHVGYVRVKLGPEIAASDAVRVSLTNNLSEHTAVEILADQPLGRGPRIESLSLTQRIGTVADVDLAIRASVSSWHKDRGNAKGMSLRLLARRALTANTYLHLQVAGIRSDDLLRVTSRQTRGEIGLSVVHRF